MAQKGESEWSKLKSELASGRVQLKKGETPMGRVMNMPRGRWVIFGSVILVSMTISTLLMPSREEMRELEEQQRKARLERLGRTQQSAKDTN
ncbi:uncharacterized protein ACA1_282950 [Acanthamoeba castellanii str. Neff]|uniref:Uncharacterized protein n=1 Tax=Acanthamoeba castellanii (strain ATCC 30010 / Neff) TaxID=1257118 RepID=L8H6J7_ACACF|nr:uncharacterized protein ACA1_282950 [Acanthamoeba castellanii str. Neff]ELR21109.1 hypothetical protein ACA1_282950 [Acanthamoeba castellanii str. Neff]